MFVFPVIFPFFRFREWQETHNTHTTKHTRERTGAATKLFSLKKKKGGERGLDGGSVPARLKSLLHRHLHTAQQRKTSVCTCVCSSPSPPLFPPVFTPQNTSGRTRGGREGSGRETTAQKGEREKSFLSRWRERGVHTHTHTHEKVGGVSSAIQKREKRATLNSAGRGESFA
jgi:hypothetical protein